MTDTMPSAVDLRSNIETVYHQAGTNACTAHAVVSALDAMYDHAGQSQRFSRAWVWWWSRVNSGRSGQDVGATFPDLKFALEKHGAVLESDHPWTGSAANFPPKNVTSRIGQITFIRVAPEVDEIKRRLCLGVPTIICARLHADFNKLFGQKDWRTNSYNVQSHDTGIQHAMCIVGYDDAAGRVLIENSYGPSFADGGFCGLPYEHLRTVAVECWGVSWIEGFQLKPVEGYVSIPFYLPPSDFQKHWSANKARYKTEIEQALAAEGYQGVINYARTHGINDRMLENMFRLNRGDLRQEFEKTKTQFDWTGFDWADL